ncbi:terminase small subunit [Rhizobium sp. SL42]|uniref:terminase small subunit n=1 Tax=Rhizobium sp. SL42 TaxID=2806346 RepID=UPI001F017710|nr:terminase small subunit [Rhizobium sp. SL42]UJW75936.1 terminase small subunit [Rhizobium sp. SL42]
MDGLTHKQRRFVEEYLLCASATKAAVNAGYSAKSAQVTSSRLMDDPKILGAIEEAQADRSERTQVDADYLLKRLHEEVDADIADLYDEETGDLLPLHEWPPVWRRGLVAGVEIETILSDGAEIGRVKKLKLSDRVRRIEALGRHVSVAAFRDNIKIEGLDTLADRLFRARVRHTVDVDPVIHGDDTPQYRPGLAVSADEAEPAQVREPDEERSPAPRSETNPPSDWQPAPVYVSPIAWPEPPSMTECEYETMPDGLLSARRND